jgi:hypothetical protein
MKKDALGDLTESRLLEERFFHNETALAALRPRETCEGSRGPLVQ